MELSVKATTLLEGDGPLALTAYEELISLEYYPNVAALAKQQSQGSYSQEQLLLTYIC